MPAVSKAGVEATARAIAAALRPGQLVVLESTTWPGTTAEVMVCASSAETESSAPTTFGMPAVSKAGLPGSSRSGE
jgi:UDP-N-acetyl-D-mannosaminuronate dehydrogenase